MIWDKEKALNHLQSNKLSVPSKWCAKYTREAIEAGGLLLQKHEYARDYGPSLIAAGFKRLPSTPSVCKPGDVVVMEGITSCPEGHMAMFDGRNWISDFLQIDMYPGPGFRQARPQCFVYRWPVEGKQDMSESPAKILVTGFSAFGLRANPVFHGNRSKSLCESLVSTSKNEAEFKIIHKILDAEFPNGNLLADTRLTGASKSIFLQMLRTERPAGVLMMGEVQKLQAIVIAVRPEASANISKAISISRRFAREQAAKHGQPDVRGDARFAPSMGLGACNELYRDAIQWARDQHPEPPVLFLHCSPILVLQQESEVKQYFEAMKQEVRRLSQFRRLQDQT